MLWDWSRLIIALLMLILSSCGGQPDESMSGDDQEAAEKIVERAVRLSGGGNVDVDPGSGSVRFGDTTISRGPGAQLPDDFPDDIPVPEDAELLSSAVNEKEAAYKATWAAKTQIAEVVDFITAGMNEEGWKSNSVLDTPNQKILAYNKDDRSATFIIAGNDERSTITFSTAKE